MKKLRVKATASRSGSEERKRQKRAIFRVTEDEHAEIEANALAAGLTMGSFLRSLAMKKPRTRAVRRNHPDMAKLAQLLGPLGRIGGNLAQLVKKANNGINLPRGELERTLAAIRATAQDVQTALRS